MQDARAISYPVANWMFSCRKIDVEKLAAEGLYYLTAAEPVWKLKKDKDENGDKAARRKRAVTPPPMLVEEARSLLGKFELDAESTIEDLDARLRAQLETIDVTLADELVLQLRGWIDRVARDREWHDDSLRTR